MKDKKVKVAVEELTDAKFAPEENEYNWAEPFIAQLICEDKNLKT